MSALIRNRTTGLGQRLGRLLARLCDNELIDKPDNRCATCAFRAGDHLANGSPETLMDALKCAIEGTPFFCHEHDRPCAGWQAMRARGTDRGTVPWDFIGGFDLP